jgi:hypothetical protein
VIIGTFYGRINWAGAGAGLRRIGLTNRLSTDTSTARITRRSLSSAACRASVTLLRMRGWTYRRTGASAPAAMLAAWGAVVVLSPWPAAVTLRHVVAALNCDAARLVGLAPTVRGGPGFWPRHDADGDGVACEPMPAVRVVR